MNMDMAVVSTSDSGLSSDYSSEMESLTSSNYHFREIDGRRHHGIVNNPYFHPCDDSEKSRLDGLQYIFRSVYGRNVMVGLVKRPTLIIDVGTGSGAWPIEVADEYPTARVIGMDLAPIQPQMVPQNCEFIVGDLTEDLEEFHEGSVDLVQARLVHAGVQTHEWPQFIQNVFRILKPGVGWAQFIELNGSSYENGIAPPDCLDVKFQEYLFKMMIKRNTPPPEAEDFKCYFEDIGFTEVKVVEKLIDIGAWSTDRKRAAIGRVAAEIFNGGVSAILAKLTEFIPDDEERKAFGEELRKEYKSGDKHIFFRTYMVVGRKPNIKLS